MSLTNLRRQHAVGQGFFHSAELHDEDGIRLRYVYDCGAMTGYARSRCGRIRAHLRTVGARSVLDLLFISHAHADHLNGLPQLLHAKTGVRVDTIVLPYFDVIERLIGFARDATEDPATTADGFYRDFVISPVAALSRFSPRQIIFVRSAGEDGAGAPDLGGDPDRPGPEVAGPDTRKGAAWKLVGRGVLFGDDGENAPTPSSGPLVATMPDSMGIAVPGRGGAAGHWLLSPFIDPAVERKRDVFKSALRDALNDGKPPSDQIGAADFDDWIHDRRNREVLVLERVKELSVAYATVEKDVNVSSMCLYSGPLPDPAAPPGRYFGKFGRWSSRTKGSMGWLATGDADLGDDTRRSAFLVHYESLLEHVVTLTIPHHGSERNFDPELLTRVDPSFCVAAAAPVGTWRHPGTAVVQAIASHGLFLSVVTSATSSQVEERAVSA